MVESLNICSICKKGILELKAEVGIEGEGDPEKFQRLGRKKIYQCDNCQQRFVKVGDNEYIRIEESVKANSIH